MLRTFLFLSFWTYLSSTLLGQYLPKDQARWSLSFAPLNLLDPITSTLEGGIGITLPSNCMLEVRYGVPSQLSKWFNPNLENEYYREIKMGSKWLAGQNDAIDHAILYYLGIEFFQIWHRYTKRDDHYFLKEERINYALAEMHRSTQTLRMVGGFHFPFRDAWYMETFAGLGIRRQQIHYDVLQSSPATNLPDVLDWDQFYHRDAGVHWKPDFLIGCRVGFFFGQRSAAK